MAKPGCDSVCGRVVERNSGSQCSPNLPPATGRLRLTLARPRLLSSSSSTSRRWSRELMTSVGLIRSARPHANICRPAVSRTSPAFTSITASRMSPPGSPVPDGFRPAQPSSRNDTVSEISALARTQRSSDGIALASWLSLSLLHIDKRADGSTETLA